MVDSRAQSGKEQGEPGTSLGARKQGNVKKSIGSKGHRNKLEGTPPGQI